MARACGARPAKSRVSTLPEAASGKRRSAEHRFMGRGKARGIPSDVGRVRRSAPAAAAAEGWGMAVPGVCPAPVLRGRKKRGLSGPLFLSFRLCSEQEFDAAQEIFAGRSGVVVFAGELLPSFRGGAALPRCRSISGSCRAGPDCAPAHDPGPALCATCRVRPESFGPRVVFCTGALRLRGAGAPIHGGATFSER